MKKNIGSIDRLIRVVLGFVLLSMAVFEPRTAWGYIGLLPLLTGLFGYCPLYAAFGWSTNHREHKAHA